MVSDAPDDPNAYTEGDLYRTLVRVRSTYHSWSYVGDWGTETRWTEAFNDDRDRAEEVGPKKLNQFFRSLDLHCIRGREMLEELKSVGFMSRQVRGDAELVRDTFLQTHDLIVLILSEVKFVEVKVDEHNLYNSSSI